MHKQLTSDQIKAGLRRLPYSERCALLTLSIVEHHKNEPIAAVLGFIELASRLSQYFNEDKRYRVADRLRTAADLCEKKVLAD
jgi:hypothetical protein